MNQSDELATTPIQLPGDGAILYIPAQQLQTPTVTLTEKEFDMLSAGASLQANDRSWFFFCGGVFVAGAGVITTALPDSRPVADGWMIVTAVSFLGCVYTASRARIGAGMVRRVRESVKRS